jgi:hypothetical protein
MDDAFSMRGFQRTRGLNAQPECFFDFERPVTKAVLHSLTFEILHDEEGATLVLTEVIYGADVGMVQRRDSKCFTLEALKRMSVISESVRDKLEGDEALQANVFGLVHHTHAAAAQLPQDEVMRDGRADHGEGPEWERC